MQQAERTAEQVDAGGRDRWADAVVVEDQRLDEIVQVRLVIRDVDDASGAVACCAMATCSSRRSTFRRIGQRMLQAR
jgi:hypothetical protein